MTGTPDFGPPSLGDPSVSIPVATIRGLDRVRSAKDTIRGLIQSGNHAIDLDFEAIQGVSSDVIGFLVWCQMECSRNRVDLRVSHASSDVLKLLRFTGLNQVIRLKETG